MVKSAVVWNDDSADADLVAAARGGDDLAFAALIRAHQNRVERITIRMLGAGDEAEDVAQDTFIRFYEALDKFRGDSAVGTYVSRIAMNLSLNALRRRRWQLRRFVRDDTVRSEVFALPAPETGDAAEISERRAVLERAVGALSDEHRAVVVCRLLEEFSTRETAELLRIPEGTVMSRLTRALEKLRVTLGHSGLEHL